MAPGGVVTIHAQAVSSGPRESVPIDTHLYVRRDHHVMVQIAVIAGIGAGTGSALAHKFALKYPVALLARSQENLDPVVESIKKKGGQAKAFVTDVSDQENMETTFKRINEEFPGFAVAAAVYNVGGAFKRGPFFDCGLEDFLAAQKSNTTGAYLFSQHVLRNQVSRIATQAFPEYSPTLLFTGATASVKGGPASSAFSVGKFGVRALSQSLAREFAPKGIHVAHAIIDGIIGNASPSSARAMLTMPRHSTNKGFQGVRSAGQQDVHRSDCGVLLATARPA